MFSGWTDSSSMQGKSQFQNITILDARTHNPGPFSQTGFTLIKLDEVGLTGTKQFLSTSSEILLYKLRNQEQQTGDMQAKTSMFFKSR